MEPFAGTLNPVDLRYILADSYFHFLLPKHLSGTLAAEMTENEKHIITWPMLAGYNRRHILDSVDEIMEDF